MKDDAKRALPVVAALLLLAVSSSLPREPKVEVVRLTEVEVYKTSFLNISVPVFGSPVEGGYGISSPFGFRDKVIEGMGGSDGDFHKGLDIVPYKKDANILAAASGIVEVHYPPPSRRYKGHPVYGALIVLNHGNGVYSVYGHMKKTFVKVGQFIEKGEVIGVVGSTGLSTGIHLHFEIQFDPSELF